MSQSNMPRQITVAEMAPHVHTFTSGENKVNKISAWLISWIKKSLKEGTIKAYDLLPSKGDLAFHTGVSKGTIQSVFRLVEDYGLLESKQKIGTYIKCGGAKRSTGKLTSKREFAVEEIKKYLHANGYQEGDCLISIRKLSAYTGISSATIRIAIGSLISENIIRKENNVFIINRMNFNLEEVQVQTLVEKIAESMRLYITQNYQAGEKLPANMELAHKFNVSIKTIHDAVKLLSKEGILYTRRGQYGTVVVNNIDKNIQYYYEKVEFKLRNYIMENCDIGSRLPSIADLATQYQVSAKTVKKALDNLADEGYITFARGRYGGTFVTDIPQGNEGYKWLAISREYAQ